MLFAPAVAALAIAVSSALADKPWVRFRQASPVYQALKEWS